jgi:hypothetical protein
VHTVCAICWPSTTSKVLVAGGCRMSIYSHFGPAHFWGRQKPNRPKLTLLQSVNQIVRFPPPPTTSEGFELNSPSPWAQHSVSRAADDPPFGLSSILWSRRANGAPPRQRDPPRTHTTRPVPVYRSWRSRARYLRRLLGSSVVDPTTSAEQLSSEPFYLRSTCPIARHPTRP